MFWILKDMTSYVPGFVYDTAFSLGAVDDHARKAVRADENGRSWVETTDNTLVSYWRRVQEMWWGTGEEDVVYIRRPLHIRSRSGRGKDVVWLADEFEALSRVPKLGLALRELIEAEPDLTTVQALLSPWKVEIEDESPENEARQVVISVTVPTAAVRTWGGTYDGGDSSPGEVGRIVTVWCHYPEWENKKLRRLRRIAVETVEMWPTPLAGECEAVA